MIITTTTPEIVVLPQIYPYLNPFLAVSISDNNFISIKKVITIPPITNKTSPKSWIKVLDKNTSPDNRIST